MAQQGTYPHEIVPEILASIDREVAAVQADYKAALGVAAERLQEAQRREAQRRPAGPSRGGASGTLVDEAPPEIEPETAMALHKLETRLDQLKELRTWIKIDPDLARFVVALMDGGRDGRADGRVVPQAQPAVARLEAPTAEREAPAASARGLPLSLVAIVAVLALVAGWLLSLALPAATLLPH